jgi:hypothetical protein
MKIIVDSEGKPIAILPTTESLPLLECSLILDGSGAGPVVHLVIPLTAAQAAELFSVEEQDG